MTAFRLSRDSSLLLGMTRVAEWTRYRQLGSHILSAT
jgi:hypothetical protein